MYEGGWKEDKKHGRGSYLWANRDTYNGEWNDDQQVSSESELQHRLGNSLGTSSDVD